MMHQLCPLGLMHEKISSHQGHPHYVWRLKMDLVTTRFVIEFSISMSLNWVIEKFWSPTFNHHSQQPKLFFH
jgi:hypothetical protein